MISLFSGVCDRASRKLLIIGATRFVATATFILALFFPVRARRPVDGVSLSGIRSLGTGIQTPAVNAMPPQIVPADKLTRIGGINGSLQSVMLNILSPAAAGPCCSRTGIHILYRRFHSGGRYCNHDPAEGPMHEKAKLKQKGGYLGDLKDFKYVLGSGFFRSYFLFCALFFFPHRPGLAANAADGGAHLWR